MKTLERISKELLNNFTDDGDTLDIGNGKMLRLVITPDEDTLLNDFDYYGQIEWVRVNDCGRHTRPESFDGRAQVISSEWYQRLWWQPPTDMTHPEDIRQIKRLVLDIIEYGFNVVTLQLCENEDAYGNPIIIDYACLGGVEPFSDLTDIVSDLASELGVI